MNFKLTNSPHFFFSLIRELFGAASVWPNRFVTMNNISVLDIFSKVFQILCLQCFSLKSVNEKTKGKYPSIYYTVYIIFILAGSTVFAFMGYKNFSSTSKADNYLNLVIKFLNFANYFGSIFFCLIFTFVKNLKLLRFFQLSTKIANLCSTEFNHDINFKKLRKPLAVPLILYSLLFIVLFFRLAKFSVSSGIFVDVVEPVCWLIIVVFIFAIVFRFYFYVCIVNFHLEVLRVLITENFSSESEQTVFDRKTMQIMRVYSNMHLKRGKIVVLRKIYMMIKEMASCVNETMGFAILLRLLMIISNMIRFGYDFLRNISESVSTLGNIWCKSCKTLTNSESCYFHIFQLLSFGCCTTH